MEFMVIGSCGEAYIIQCLMPDEEGKQQLQVISHNHPSAVGPRKSPKHGAWSVHEDCAFRIQWHCCYIEGMEKKVPVHDYERLCAYIDGKKKYTNVWKLTKKNGYPVEARYMHTITPME